MKSITQEEVRALFDYSPETGELRWRVRRAAHVPAGALAGWIDELGYRRVGIQRSTWMAHHLVWLYVHGHLPKEIDHINLIKTDNRITNLRIATREGNNQNRVAPLKNNRSGFLGVSFHKATKMFVARIKHKRKDYHLGCFKNPEEAHAAYIKAKRQIHEFNTL